LIRGQEKGEDLLFARPPASVYNGFDSGWALLVKSQVQTSSLSAMTIALTRFW